MLKLLQLITLLFLWAAFALAIAINGEDAGEGNSYSNNNEESNEEMVDDLRITVYVGMIELCTLCSIIVGNLRRPVEAMDPDLNEAAGIIRNNLV